MCYVITIAVPEKQVDILRATVPSGFHIEAEDNPSVLAALPAKYRTFLMTSGGCSCGLYRQDPGPGGTRSDAEHRRRAYKKKGWSEAKIERAIQQFKSKKPHADFRGFREDVVTTFQNLARATPRFAVLVHWYKGFTQSETIPLGEAKRVEAERIGDVAPDEDRLWWVTASKSS